MEAKNDSHYVSVVIPTIERSTLSFLLKALEQQTRKPDEVIIMKDEFRRGPSIMRNEGIAKAKGDLVAFLDDDVVPGNDWLEIFINAIDEYNADVVSSNYLETDPFLHDIRERRKMPKEIVVNPGGFAGIGGNIIYKKSALKECMEKDGYVFDEHNKVSQDIQLAARMLAYGCKFVWVVNYVKHLRKVSVSQFIKFQFNRGIGIQMLHSYKKSHKNLNVDSGMLWNENSRIGNKWISIILHRIIGPFDIKSFSKLRYFVLFWFGEKAKAIGFAYSTFKERFI
jgi:glycosyltransferase involved in cell wall biosynthesis